MPRRPRKQPHVSNASSGAKVGLKKSGGSLKKWIRREDIEGNEEDQFHDRHDQILLGDGTALEEDGLEDGEEEVFPLGLDEESEEVESGNEQTEENQNEFVLADPSSKKNTKQIKQSKKQKARSPSSSEDSESEEVELWGRKKSAYYSSNAGILALKEGEEDEDEANEMEEQEARKIQARLRDGLSDADFGLGSASDLLYDQIAEDAWGADVGILATSKAQESAQPTLDKAVAIRQLEKSSPETLALSREWDDVANDLMQVQQRIEKQAAESPDHISSCLLHIYHQTLLSYVATLAFYLHLRAAPPPITGAAEARLKAVLERLLVFKQALSELDDLDFDASGDEADSDDMDSNISSMDEEEMAELMRLFWPSATTKGAPTRLTQRKKVDFPGLDEPLAETDATVAAKAKAKAKSKTDKAHAYISTVNGKETAKEKGREKKTLKERSRPIFDLVEPKFVPSKKAEVQADDDAADPFGEVTSLSAADKADKKARKKSLRFHTSKIETTARRREERRENMGGDDDIPYRERQKEKVTRIQKEIEKARDKIGDDLDMTDDLEISKTKKRKRDLDEGDNSEESASDEADESGYYELVERTKKKKKEEKKRAYTEARMAERIYDDETGGEGPRSLTRAILKNKGLTPRRPKSVRNPRVKKREKYEKAKQKVRSQKSVYKGGLGGRTYGGEGSGISKVVKSVKLT